MKILKILLSAFHIFFYPGSHTPIEKYQSLLHSFTPRHEIKVVETNFFRPGHPFRHYNDSDVVLIGHSFGGYFALLDYLKYPDKVRGVILLNSHFNSKNQVIYPGIKQTDVRVPVLTILSENDERLPVKWVLDDIYEKMNENLKDKYYIINNNFTHFSGISEEWNEETETISRQMNIFLNSLFDLDFKNISEMADCKKFKYDTYRLVPFSLNISKSMNVVDALLKVFLYDFIWNYYHWLYFLSRKPEMYFNYLYESKDYIYIKSKNINIQSLENGIQELSFNKNVSFHVIKLLTIHPSILIWLFLPLFISLDKKTDTLHIPIIHLPVNNETHYYKIPHPLKIFRHQYK